MMHIVVGKKKRPVGAEEIKWETIAGDELASLASTDALFGGTSVFVVVGALNGSRNDEFLGLSKEFVESAHTFIFEEEKLLKRETDIVTKAGGKIEKVESVKKDRGFDPYGLTFALGNKDKKKLWLGLMEAWKDGEKPEAVSGLLAWKARTMKDANLSREIISIYHDSHRGVGSLELLLERFALKL